MNPENQAPVDLLESKVLKDALAHQALQALQEHPAMMENLENKEILGPQEQMDETEMMDVMERKGQEDQPDPKDHQVPQDLPQRKKKNPEG